MKYRRLTLKEIDDAMAKLSDALEPMGIKILSDYKISLTQRLTKTRVNAVDCTLYFFTDKKEE